MAKKLMICSCFSPPWFHWFDDGCKILSISTFLAKVIKNTGIQNMVQMVKNGTKCSIFRQI